MLKEKTEVQVSGTSKSPSGLGKKLGGILKFSDFSKKEGSSADQILGASRPTKSSRSRQHILDLAMGAIAESFSVSAVVLARQSAIEITNFSSSLPEKWDDKSKVKFQFLGRLWAEMDAFDAQSGPVVSSHYQLPGNFQWVGLHALDDVCLAASVARPSKLSEKEAAMLQALFTSIAVSLDDSHQVIPAEVQIEACVAKDEDQFVAKVSLHAGQVTVSHSARDRDEAVAIATAATFFCEKEVTVVRAAKLFLDKQFLYFVVLKTKEKTPFIGITFAQEESPSGFVEAVVLAASAADAAPAMLKNLQKH